MRAYNLKNDKKRLCDPNFDNERSQFLVQNSPELFCQDQVSENVFASP